METLQLRDKGKLKEPKTCRIFFSSPFGGMEEEREEFTRKYYPQIQHACSVNGVQFVAVDMRWGITSQAAENAQVINTCLREIDRSDIFVGFFGQRYGWHGVDDKLLQENFDNAVGCYSWLDAVRDRSVTEMEFLHGHLNDPGALPACICFRDKGYDDAMREEGLSKGDKKQVFKYSSESDHATVLMNDLKDRVKATESKCLGVDMAYPHPHQGARFMFESIWRHLTEVLLANMDDTTATKRDQQLAEHNAFRACHVSVYEGGQQYLEFLNSMLEEGQSGVLITGPAGSGKSALLCNWTVQLAKSHPEVVLVYHFVGCAPGTTDAHDILSRLLLEMQHVLGKEEDAVKIEDKSEDAQDLKALQLLLLGAMEEVLKEKQKRVVIVLDGLDRSLKAGKTSKHLYWLPDTWPQGVLFITSTVDTDTPTLDLLVTGKGYQTLAIQPLKTAAKLEICRDVLKKSGKELSAEQLDRIVAAEQTNTPLYLRLVLSELSIFGYFRLLDKKIDSLIYCSDVGELLQKMFTRLEEDYNGKEEHTRLVQEVLCAIELSHCGLLERELMEMLGVESHVWLPMYFSMEGLLVSHAGLLRLGFAEISQAVRAKYLHSEEEKIRMLKKMIQYFDKQLQSIPAWEELLTPLSKRPVDELPWLQLAVGDMDGLSSTLLNIFTLKRMQQEFKYEFFELWKATGKKMSQICDLYESAFDLAVADLYLHYQDMPFNSVSPPGVMLRPLLSSLRELFNIACYPEGAVRMLQRDVAILMHTEGAMDPADHFMLLLDARYFLACALVDCCRFEQGEQLHRQVMAQCRSHLADNPDDKECRQILGFTCNGVGVVYIKLRQWEKAIPMFEESIEHHRQLNNVHAVADASNNLGMAHLENGDPQQGLLHLQKYLEMLEELYFGHLPLEFGNALTNLGLCYRRLDDLDQAEAVYKRSLEVKANAVGWDHDVVATAYMNLSTLNVHRQDYTTAKQLICKAMAIQENNGATLEKPDYRKTTENLLCCILSMGSFENFEEALPIYLPLFRKLQEVGEMDQCIASIHREMAKYLLHIGDADTAREVTLALINSQVRHHFNYIFLDHLQLSLPEEQRPHLPAHCTLQHGLTLWPGNPDISRHIIENYALPAGDIDTILRLQAACAEHNPDFGSYAYSACVEWCMDGGNLEAAAQVLEAGLKDYPEALDLRVMLMDVYRKMQAPTRAFPHLPKIIEGKKDDPACLIVAGDLARRSSDFQMALQCFDQVQTMDNPQLAEMAKEQAKLLREALANSKDGEGEAGESGTQQNGTPENVETLPGSPEG